MTTEIQNNVQTDHPLKVAAEANTIEVHDLRKSFNDQVVLDGVNLKLKRGETVAVLGRSGTGKSVLLKLIVGLHQPDGGSIRVFDREVTKLRMEELYEVRKRMGFVFQYSALYDSLTVAENVAFPLEHHSSMRPAERNDRVRELLMRVGMEEASRKLPSQVSGGMKKRVGLARALALDPELILFDEPTAGLDPITAAEINELIRDLQQEREMSSIVVTHDLHCVKAVSDRVLMLQDGKIHVDAKFEELERSDDRFVTEFLKQSF